MDRARIVITQSNMDRIRSLLHVWKNLLIRDHAHVERLEQELEGALVVATKEIPSKVVTMNSQVSVRDLDTGRVNVYTLVFPERADIARGRISVLAPIGMALLGYREGDLIEWEVRGGRKRLRVEEVQCQPEAEGALRPGAGVTTADAYYRVA